MLVGIDWPKRSIDSDVFFEDKYWFWFESFVVHKGDSKWLEIENKLPLSWEMDLTPFPGIVGTWKYKNKTIINIRF